MKKNTKRVLIPILIFLAVLLALYLFFFQFKKDITANIAVSIGDRRAENGHFDNAANYYEFAYSLDSSDAALIAKIAEAYRKAGNYTKTEQFYLKAIQTEPETINNYLSLSSVFVEEGKFCDAVSLLDQIEIPSVRNSVAGLRPSAPVFSPDSGLYDIAVSVSIEFPENASCYYSLDGTFPSAESGKYESAFVLSPGNTTIRAVSVSENGIVSSEATASYILSGVVENVEFEDPAIENSIRQILSADVRAITTDDLKELAFYEVPDDAKSLNDISRFTSLLSLTITDWELDSLSFLTYMPALKILDLTGCKLSADLLDFLCGFTQLEYLNLSGCELSNISALANLKSLRSLWLNNNSIRDLSSLSQLSALEELSLSENAFTEFPELSNLVGLKYLDVSNNSLESCAFAAAYPQLQTLDISGNSISDISSVSRLTRLTSLLAANNQISEIASLSACSSLTEIDISSNSVTDISALSGIDALQNICIDGNSVSVVPDFSERSCLVSFSAANNNISEISGLSGLPMLNIVNLDYNESLTDISCLLSCPNLVQIDIFNTSVTDTSMFSDINGYDRGIIINKGAPGE